MQRAPRLPEFVTFLPPAGVFLKAIKARRLSQLPDADNFAGLYMYIGTVAERDLFKNIVTRKYLA